MRKHIFLLLLLVAFLFCPVKSYAISCDDAVPSDADALRKFIESCQSSITNLQGQQLSLKSAISVFDSKIKLTTIQISETQKQIETLRKEIDLLDGVVTTLNQNLDKLSQIFVAHARQAYINSRKNLSNLLLARGSFANAMSFSRYMEIAKTKDQLMLSEITSTKFNYNNQKDLRVQKQKSVEKLKTDLDIQKLNLSAQQRSKQELLTATRNSETRYQSLLAQAKAELDAINAIFAGGGQEQEVGDIKKGDLIAHVIQGSSCNSNGTHLHFTIIEGNSDKNPFNYLKSVDHLDNSGGDPFNPSGSWDWPVSGRVTFNQGYGETWAIKNLGLWYSRHNGIDIRGEGDSVLAVQDGKLYRGSYQGNNKCTLKYVKVAHSGSSISSYYLHVNFL